MHWEIVVRDPEEGELTDEDLDDVAGGGPPPPGHP